MSVCSVERESSTGWIVLLAPLCQPVCYLDHRSDRMIVADLMCTAMLLLRMILVIVTPIHRGAGVVVVSVERVRTLRRRRWHWTAAKGRPFGGRCGRELGGYRAHRAGRLRWRCGYGARSGCCNGNEGRLFVGVCAGRRCGDVAGFANWYYGIAEQAFSHLMQIGTTLHPFRVRWGTALLLIHGTCVRCCGVAGRVLVMVQMVRMQWYVLGGRHPLNVCVGGRWHRSAWKEYFSTYWRQDRRKRETHKTHRRASHLLDSSRAPRAPC